MLQQTTVGTVLNHFEKFLNEYPTIHDLAGASEEEVCISWKGLGYYRRARNLRNLALQIVEQFSGDIPTDLDSLLSLKGVGPYTANAIVAIGANGLGLAVDANLERVLARFYGIKEMKGVKLQQKLYKEFEAKRILPDLESLGPRNLNEAFMDLGRILCQARKVTCLLCPLREKCQAYKSGMPLSFPMEEKKKAGVESFIKLLRVVVKENKKILFYQKNSAEWLAGQWELPTFILETNDELLKQYPKVKSKKQFFEAQMIKTGITKYTIENYIIEMSLLDFEKFSKSIEIEYVFKTYDEKLNLSTASIKVLKKY
jgi:A/G-specific adenine glycosylase